MLRMLPLVLSSLIASCAPAPQKAAMTIPSASSDVPVQKSIVPPTPISHHVDSPSEAQGRRIFSTAFVGVGPDGHMTVELNDGRVIVLAAVVMRPGDFCGTLVSGDPTGTRYCGGYAHVAAARPGGAPMADQPDVVAPGRAAPMHGSP